ncbi:MAG: zinc ribbon domain-containing protein [Lentisphaeria bacterium]|nr:zinc ribbon domain-containing protein [Lentisphaeria bacterium]
MHQTICQECGASNQANAIVCSKCGTKLAHRERSVGARMVKSGLLRSIVSAPGRLLKWTFKKLKAVLIALFFLAILGGGFLYFLLFVPLSWEDYPMPQPIQKDDKEIVNLMHIMRKNGGIFQADPLLIRQLGNMLIFNPDYGTYRRKNTDDQRTPDRDNGYFSFIKLPHDQFGMVLFQKINGKLPFRVQAVFIAKREKNGLLELDQCRIGNLPVPTSILRMVAKKMLTQWNPDQQFLAAFDRISKGEMELQVNGKEDKIVLLVKAAGR